MSPRTVVTGVAVVQLLAVGLWASGLLVLGAIVAPIVFHVVPPPGSADAMTVVFRRFDGVAIGCAVVALVAEAGFAIRGPTTRADVVRSACLVVAAGLAIVIAAWLSPGIGELHRSGALRGRGEAGLALERMHHLAERLAKAEVVLLLAVFVLSVARATRIRHDGTAPAPMRAGTNL